MIPVRQCRMDITKFYLEFQKCNANSISIFILCSNTIGAVATFLACIENKVVPLLLGKDLIEIY